MTLVLLLKHKCALFELYIVSYFEVGLLFWMEKSPYLVSLHVCCEIFRVREGLGCMLFYLM